MHRPHRVEFTDHAAERADLYDIATSDAADAVLELHERRTRNVGTAPWRVVSGRIVIVYEWPVDGDTTTARVVSLWLRE